jgi:signal transduction histidine kinase
MSSQSLAFLITVVLLFPMGYLLIAAPAFLLVRLSIPTVTVLLRGMFNVYLWMLLAVSPPALIVYAATAHIGLALCVALILAVALFGRRWFLRHIDMALVARDSGDADTAALAVQRLRGLHWIGMLVNLAQLATVIGGIQYLL